MLKLQKVIWNGKKRKKEKQTTHKSLKRESQIEAKPSLIKVCTAQLPSKTLKSLLVYKESMDVFHVERYTTVEDFECFAERLEDKQFQKLVVSFVFIYKTIQKDDKFLPKSLYGAAR